MRALIKNFLLICTLPIFSLGLFYPKLLFAFQEINANSFHIAEEISTIPEERIIIATKGSCRIKVEYRLPKSGKTVIDWFRFRSDCSLSIEDQMPILNELINHMSKGPIKLGQLKSFYWGRLIQHKMIASRLIQAASSSSKWQKALESKNFISQNRLVVDLLNESNAFRELSEVFLRYKMKIKVSDAEKVLIARIDRKTNKKVLKDIKIPNSVQEGNVVPFDAMIGFEIEHIE